MSALHCDGLGDSLVDNCLQQGETLYTSIEFTVTPS
jgi:hypothetical protein